MYLKFDNKYWAFDIEGDLIPSTRIWCLVAVNVITKEEVRLRTYEEIKTWFKERKQEGCKFVAHNGLGYDAPTLNRILSVGLVASDLVDTFVLSMVFNPSLPGGHSLDSWGTRLKFPKGSFNKFDEYSDEMMEYCATDTHLCRKVFITLVARLNAIGFTEKSLELEHLSWVLIRKQKENGFAFNISEAHALYAKVREEENNLKEKIHERWPPRLERVGTFKRPYNQDGKKSANHQRHLCAYPKVAVRADDNEYDCFDYVAFNIGSPPQRVEKLLELGWKPREFTKRTEKGGGGNPKVTDKGKLVPSLLEFVEESGVEEVKLIANWIDLNARGNMINNWIESYNERTGCIHGSLWLANTLRYRHSDPNTANIPAVRVNKDEKLLLGLEGAYTYEARDLWIARADDRVLVGVDAKGIQLRVLAHYLNNPKFTEAILSADPHEANKVNFKLPTRALAKTITYATLMGAGDAKVASEAKIGLKEAKEVKERFFEAVPELPRLISRLKRQLRQYGRIQLCDGSWIIVPSDHMVIPYLLQGDESRIMKRAAIVADILNRKRNLDVLKVGDIHDEWQNDVFKPHSEEFAREVCPLAFRNSGRFFDYNLPIDCDAKIDLTWARTH